MNIICHIIIIWWCGDLFLWRMECSSTLQ